MSPLREYEVARAARSSARRRLSSIDLDDRTVVGRWRSDVAAVVHARALRQYRRALLRLILSALAWGLVVALGVVALWLFLVILSAVAPAPTDVQLPTL